MIGSLLRHQPDAAIHVLCLDDACLKIVEAALPQMPGVVPIPLTSLEAHDPALAACKAGRSKIEYYFSCTPCLPTYILERNPDIDSITYLDGDLFFYSSPELIFDEIGENSVAIVPHRFSPDNQHEVRHGIFNVAWITWRNDAIGRRCLADYRRNCLDWCYDRLEDGKFADQKYLDAWPQTYPRVKSLDHKGANLALWNVDNYDIRRSDDGILVDGQPLIFFHFQNIKHLGPHRFAAPSFASYKVRRHPELLVAELYQPYLDLLESSTQQLHDATGINFYIDQREGFTAPAEASGPEPRLLAALQATALARPHVAVVGVQSQLGGGVQIDRFEAGVSTLPYGNDGVDAVLIGPVAHLPALIAESRRVARHFCLFDGIPVTPAGEAELRLLFARLGLEVQAAWAAGQGAALHSFLCRPFPPLAFPGPALLNLGCGNHLHPAWLNIDIAPDRAGVMDWNIRGTLPCGDQTFDAVYHSHVLEHLPKDDAPAFLTECFRVLKPGGVLRVVIPDLETICRVYLDQLDQAAAGDEHAAQRYDWILLEMLDQTVRNHGGGGMADFLRQDPLPIETFVLGRIGAEGKGLIDSLRGTMIPSRPAASAEAIGRFRLGGEVHQWMYDRFSLARLLRAAGFTEVAVSAADRSAVPDFAAYGLDLLPNGAIRKPDSLFMEGRRPADS